VKAEWDFFILIISFTLALMKFDLRLTQEDYVNFQLFNIAGINSKSFQRNKLIVCGIAFLWSLFMFSLGGSYLFFIVPFLYPFYHHWRYRNAYKKNAKMNLKIYFGKDEESTKPSSLHFNESEIESIDENAATKLKPSAFTVVYDTPEYLYAMMDKGMGLILPKQNIVTSSVLEWFNNHSVEIVDKTDWKYGIYF